MLLSFLYFIIAPYLLSYWTDFVTDWDADLVETTIMRWGVGVATLIALAPIFEILSIPIHYASYLVVGVLAAGAAMWLGKADMPRMAFSQRELYTYAAVFICFFATATMYYVGTYGYSYFENGDPWGYGAVVNTIAEENTYEAPYRYNHYSEPYTQGYQVFLAVLHQLNDSLHHTMKGFNQAYFAFSILFFFFLAKRLFNNYPSPDTVAMFATIALTVIPSWISHFMFSLNFNMVQLLVFVYALTRTYQEKEWWPVAGAVLAAIIVTHQYTAVVTLLLFFVFMLTRFVKDGRLPVHDWYASLIAAGVGLVYYVPWIVEYYKYFETPVRESFGRLETGLTPIVNTVVSSPVLSGMLGILAVVVTAFYTWYAELLNDVVVDSWGKTKRIASAVIAVIVFLAVLFSGVIHFEGSASRMYGVSDFFSAGPPNMINNPVGWGPIIPLLVPIAIAFFITKRRSELLSDDSLEVELLVLFVFTFLFTLGMYFPTRISPFRFWTYLAVFTSLLSGAALYIIYRTSAQINEYAGYLVATVLIAILVYTTFIPKYNHQTAQWPETEIRVPDSQQFHTVLQGEPYKDSTVVNLCNRQFYLAAYDVNPLVLNPTFTPEWRWPNASRAFHQQTYNMTGDEIVTTLQNNNVDYAIAGGSCIDQREDQQRVQRLLQKVQNQSGLTPVEQGPTSVLFRVS